MNRIRRYVRSWVVSIRLKRDREWQRQMAETAVVTEPAPANAEALRRLLMEGHR